MELIIKTITEAVQDNLITIFLLLLCIGLFEVSNIVLGMIINMFGEGFKFKKFFMGLFKAIATMIIILVFCYALNLFALTLKQVDIQISTNIITVMEVVTVIVTWGVDLAKDCLEKVKNLKELKYVSYDDVTYDNGFGSEDKG